ncbi:unnamed protein product [Linum tenue]|uniref:Uncharacterized protein n=1 Tax=Linum tenue TaxID=586396 RepID=A0AAV0QR26_9ROSI|nr:unnamed protein product [Linum tenue]
MSTSKAFTLKSDQIFITPCVICSRTLDVYWYKGDLNDDFQGTRGEQTRRRLVEHWDISFRVRVGPLEQQYKALQVFGTTVKRNKLRTLVNDLIKMRGGSSAAGFNVFVNRIGLCIISPVNGGGGGALRINDLFGWSKYGVKLPRDVGTGYTVWDRVDMYTGETVLDVRGMVRAGNELAARSKQISSKLEEEEEFTDRPDDRDRCDEKLLDQHSSRVTSIGMYTAATKVGGTFSSAEEGNQELRRRLEEKSAELMACKKELEWSKKTESLLSKLVDEKSAELMACRKELEWSKKTESLLSKLVDEKSAELMACKKELEWSKKTESLLSKELECQLEATQARREVASLRARSEVALAIRQRTLIERETAARDVGAVLAEREAAVAAAEAAVAAAEATLNENFPGVREMLATAAEDAVRAREVAVAAQTQPRYDD